jgi:bla regulator protein blaR1
MIASQLQCVANHLWQSTVFTAAAGLLNLVLRKNRAQARYWVWLVASVKFLIPFSVLIDLGSQWGRHAAPAMAPPVLSYVIQQASQPFSVPTSLVTTPAGPASSLVNWVPDVLYALWVIGSAMLICSWWRRWRGLRAAFRTASPLDLPISIKALSSPAFAEPGVFGVRRPVLLLPAGITDRLTPVQLKAIVAHELCHVRRHDNLGTAIHMGVEALFWFHPLVWWLGARLMEEREQACDEEVLLTGNEPQAYAEGILKLCELYLESPLPCVSGVAGANLRKRIEEIMSNRIGIRLSFARKAALAVAGVAVVAGPTIVGIINAPFSRAQSRSEATPTFEVTSVKPSAPDAMGRSMLRDPSGRFTAENATLKMLICYAYNVRDHQVIGAKGWLDSVRYDVIGKPEGRPNTDRFKQMVQSLLGDRFELRLRHDSRELPIFKLVIAKNGPKLIPWADSAGPVVRGAHGKLIGQKVSMRLLADALTRRLDRSVFDKTGLSGMYDFTLEWTPDERPTPPAMDPGDRTGGSTEVGPSIFTAIQEQLGLRLAAAKGPVDVLVVEGAERPKPN